MDSSQRLQELFALYLERRCRPEEVAELVELLGREDADGALEPAMQALWDQLREEGVRHAVDWDSMYERVVRTEDDLYRLGRRRRLGTRARYWIAALVILMAGSGLWWILAGRGGGDPVRAQLARRIVHLPDGSTVMLNTNSQLDYPKVFAADKREVTLYGEGYFEVVPGPGKPFIVRSGKLITKVLGTSFNIRAYPTDSAVAITVTKGKVMVMREGLSMGVLTDRQQLNFINQSEHVSKKEVVDIEPVIAWTPAEIGFDDLTMEEAARRLEKRFNVRISFAADSLRQMRVTATFNEDDSLEEILAVLCGVVKSSYRIHNNQITIYGLRR